MGSRLLIAGDESARRSRLAQQVRLPSRSTIAVAGGAGITRFAIVLFAWFVATRGLRIGTLTRFAMVSPRHNRSASDRHAFAAEARAYSMVLVDAYNPFRRRMLTGHRRERLARPAYGGARHFVEVTLSVTSCALPKIVYKASEVVAIARTSS